MQTICFLSKIYRMVATCDNTWIWTMTWSGKAALWFTIRLSLLKEPGFWSQNAGFHSLLLYLLASWLWKNYLISLKFSFLIGNTEIIMILISLGRFKYWGRYWVWRQLTQTPSGTRAQYICCCSKSLRVEKWFCTPSPFMRSWHWGKLMVTSWVEKRLFTEKDLANCSVHQHRASCLDIF
jgi:hypothetical protein